MSRGLTGTAVLLACAGLIAGCGSRPARTSPPPVAAPLSTSLVTAQGTWAVAVMGGAGERRQILAAVRPARGRQPLVPGHAAGRGRQRRAGRGGRGRPDGRGLPPSRNLVFSPLATSIDAGRNWTPGLLDAGLADTPGAIAVGPSGRTLALLQDGTIQAAQMRGDSAAAGQWAPLTTLKALAASAPGRTCGLTGVTAVSFGPDKNPIAAGSCARPGAAGVFTDASGTWRSAGLALRNGAGCGCSA